MAEINWMECELIESVEGKCGGRPVVVGTRVFPEPIVNGWEMGQTVEELQENYPSLSLADVERLIAFAHEQRFRTAA